MRDMKRILIPFFSIFITFPLLAQASYSGTAEMNITANAPESMDEEDLFSREDLGMEDISLMSALTAKMDAGDETTTFSAWFSIGENTDPAIDDYTLDLMRFSVNIYISDTLSVEIGRQSLLTGYGYGWNPIDFVNPRKNPADPDADLRGVDGVALRVYPNETTSLKLYGILPDVSSTGERSYEEVKAGTEMTLYLPGVEFMLSGFWDYDSNEGSDDYTPSVGTAAMVDILGAGVYTELALRQGSRNSFPDGLSAGTRKVDWLFSGLLGLEYTFGSELYAVVEYFYNGEGYDKLERTDFETSLPLNPDLFNLYSPGYFGRHYVLVNLTQPFYDINTDATLSVLVAPDSGALTLMPMAIHNFSGSFSVQIGYTGLFDLKSDDFNELSALPIRHLVNALFSYSF